MRYELKSIGVWSFVRTSFFIHLVFGFVVGLFYAAIFGLMMAVFSSLPYGSGDTGFDPSTIGPIMIVLLPIICSVGMAVFGTFFTAVLVIAYNLIVRMVGGVEFELEAAVLTQVATVSARPVMHPQVPVYPPPPPPPSTAPSGPTYTPPPPSFSSPGGSAFPPPPPPGPGLPSGPAYTPPPAPPKFDWTPPTPPPSDAPRGPEPENQ